MKEQKKNTHYEKEEQGNSIYIGSDGVNVTSTTESLKEIVMIIDYLIEKHKDFLIQKKNNKVMMGVG